VIQQNDPLLDKCCDATTSENYTIVKFTLRLYGSGLLNPRRNYLTPTVVLEARACRWNFSCVVMLTRDSNMSTDSNN
jgi:hypothetical protein